MKPSRISFNTSRTTITSQISTITTTLFIIPFHPPLPKFQPLTFSPPQTSLRWFESLPKSSPSRLPTFTPSSWPDKRWEYLEALIIIAIMAMPMISIVQSQTRRAVMKGQRNSCSMIMAMIMINGTIQRSTKSHSTSVTGRHCSKAASTTSFLHLLTFNPTQSPSLQLPTTIISLPPLLLTTNK